MCVFKGRVCGHDRVHVLMDRVDRKEEGGGNF